MANGITFPTAPEAYEWAYGLPDIEQQKQVLGTMGTQETMWQAMQPFLQKAYAQIGRSGLPSSSYADRLLTGIVAPLWAQQQQNVLAGWQNLGRQLPGMMGAYWTPPQMMMQAGAMPSGAVPGIESMMSQPTATPQPAPYTPYYTVKNPAPGTPEWKTSGASSPGMWASWNR